MQLEGDIGRALADLETKSNKVKQTLAEKRNMVFAEPKHRLKIGGSARARRSENESGEGKDSQQHSAPTPSARDSRLEAQRFRSELTERERLSWAGNPQAAQTHDAEICQSTLRREVDGMGVRRRWSRQRNACHREIGNRRRSWRLTRRRPRSAGGKPVDSQRGAGLANAGVNDGPGAAPTTGDFRICGCLHAPRRPFA